MDYRIIGRSSQREVAEHFTAVFSASEGATEGQRIGDLASKLCSSVDNQDVIAMGAYEAECLVGSIFFTRLEFDQAVGIYMLAPVAVSTLHQRQGVGQGLIRFGLDWLQHQAVDVAVTYGDRAFYNKVGFQALSESVIRAPLRLSMPMGWLGQSLTEKAIPTIQARPRCVEAFNDPALW